MINIINQIFEIEYKLKLKNEDAADRNIKRLYHELETLGYNVINPINRSYKETDTDIEASLAGLLKGELKVTRVLKPIVYQKIDNGQLALVQKGIVIVEGE
jgi:hypothetical protein